MSYELVNEPAADLGDLGYRLIKGGLPWDYAAETTMAAFLGAYTLHDSSWIGCWTTFQQESVAVIRWDTYWAQDRVPFPPGPITGWPILLIRFAHLYQLQRKDTILSRASLQQKIDAVLTREVSPAKAAAFLRPTQVPHMTAPQPEHEALPILLGSLHRTRIFGSDNGVVTFWHSAPVSLLCFAASGELLRIPGL